MLAAVGTSVTDYRQVLVRLLNGRTLCLELAGDIDLDDVQCGIESRVGLPVEFQSLYDRRTGQPVYRDTFNPVLFADLELRGVLLGGKGGFGSLLRGSSTKVGQKATSNFTACRDLSGRRIRHVEDEKAIEAWKEQQAKSSSNSSSVSKSILKQYSDIKHERAPERELCKYGDDCKYRYKNCRFGHPRNSKKEDISLMKDYSCESDIPIDIPDMKSAIEAGLKRSRERAKISVVDATIPAGSSKRTRIEDVAATTARPVHKINGLEFAKPALPNFPQSSVPKNDTEAEEEIPKVLAAEHPPVVSSIPVSSIDLAVYAKWEDLQALGMEGLKLELQARKLKCGGSVALRAQRLFLLKNHSRDQISQKHWAK